MNTKQHHLLGWILGSLTILLCVGLILAAYRFEWPGTGFQGKTVWDWLQLLIIPLVLTLAAVFFNQANARTERQIAQERYERDLEIAENRYKQDQQIALDKQREDLLQVYLDRMSELLLKEDLEASQPGTKVRNIARARTLNLLIQLDARRIGYVFAFLDEAQLAKDSDPIVDLKQANLTKVDWSSANFRKVNLSGANLQEANLSGATFESANFSGANLQEANLSKAFFESANFSGARLYRANLSGASFADYLAYLLDPNAKVYAANLTNTDFRYANLTNACLFRADLSKANLWEVNLSGAQLQEANLSYANLSYANLSYANLSDAGLSDANLTGANLTNAILTAEQLTTIKSLKDATLPNGARHP